jgi:ABC-type lipoprotein release transport system permease subunit
MDERLSQSRIARNSLKFHWRTQVAVALGVAAATAVLVGALLVGDSVRGSLRHLVLDRLGRIDQVLVVDRFFRQSLADELAEEPQFKQSFTSAVPAVLFPAATVEQQTASGKRLASGVLVVGSGAAFWQLDRPANRPKHVPGDGEIVINRPLADELGAKVGDTLVVRFGKGDQVPADSPLGRRTGRIATLAELTLVEIIPAAGLGQFSLQQSQMAPRNAYVSLTAVQGALDQANMANTVFIGGRDFDQPALAAAAKELPKLLSPHLTDYGLSLEHVEMTYGRGDQARPIYDYYSLFSERMLIEPAMERVVRQALEGLHAQPLLTYLANDIRRVQGSGDSEIRSAGGGIPYSTITAMDPAPGGPLVDADGKPLAPLSDDEIVLTSWAAEDQHAAIGDTIRVSYFEPETTHGQAVERSVDLRVQAIVPLTEPKSGYSRRGPAIYDEPPTPANDPHLTPEVKGITDQASIADWDPPFPFDQKRIRPQDDEYWENHRTTPKAYVSLKTGQRLWGSRFGNVTSFRIPAAAGVTTESMEEKVLAAAKPSEERLGFAFLPLKRQGLAAASGTTPFDVLFLLLSMFIIAAAIMLVWLLFRLGVEQRADEIGLLLALGWTRSRVRRLFVLEGAVVAAAGAVLGVGFGLAYAWLMIAGLRTWWVGAIATPFLQLHATPLSLVAGFFLGWAASIATIWVSLRRAKKAVVRQLLAGQFVTATAVEPGSPAIRRGRRTTGTAAVCFAAAVRSAY